MNKIMIMFLMMFTIASSQTATITNSVIGYTTVGDSVSFEKPSLWSFIKDDNSKWMLLFGLMHLGLVRLCM